VRLQTRTSQLQAYSLVVYVVIQVTVVLASWQLVAYIKTEGEQWFKLPDALLDFIINACQTA